MQVREGVVDVESVEKVKDKKTRVVNEKVQFRLGNWREIVELLKEQCPDDQK